MVGDVFCTTGLGHQAKLKRAIIEFQVELETLDNDRVFRDVGVEIRQVIDIEINQVVTEYRAQILQDELGNKIKAKFPLMD